MATKIEMAGGSGTEVFLTPEGGKEIALGKTTGPILVLINVPDDHPDAGTIQTAE